MMDKQIAAEKIVFKEISRNDNTLVQLLICLSFVCECALVFVHVHKERYL